MTGTLATGCDLVVLCGGLGTRLRPVVSDRPKSMALIDDRPFLDFVLEHFIRHGVERVVLCTGYRSDVIDAWYRGARRPYELVISHEASPLGTAGALKQAAPSITSDPFLVVNGDSLIDIDPNELLGFHALKQGAATVALVEAGARADVGFVSLDCHGRVAAFAEKRPDAAAKYHNAGLYVFGRDLLEDIPEGCPYAIETDLLPALLPRGVFGFASAAPLYDIGTPERLAGFRASRRSWSTEWLSGRATAGSSYGS